MPAIRLGTDTKTDLLGDLRTAYLQTRNSAMRLIFPAIVCVSSLLAILRIHVSRMFRAGMGLLGIYGELRLPEVPDVLAVSALPIRHQGNPTADSPWRRGPV